MWMLPAAQPATTRFGTGCNAVSEANYPRLESPDHASEPNSASGSQSLYRADTPADVASQRAKSQSHGKITADRWNQ